ncbi:hypothetical protein BAE44_0004087 [Dichanthelium oligosanthes]|uniref:Uncharacterized protein n=1 Tax=Dichanthelium oligosanthes TaxID=888268 RepID=A0A1E5WC47_9POAL|nr:hypothetical protein BAE44_0004087 [Dichanthelium oligosanthes]
MDGATGLARIHRSDGKHCSRTAAAPLKPPGSSARACRLTRPAGGGRRLQIEGRRQSYKRTGGGADACGGERQGTDLRMQSLLRNVCRAGSGAAARLLEFAAPVATHLAATQSSSAIQYLRPYGFGRPIGIGFLLEIQAVGILLSPVILICPYPLYRVNFSMCRVRSFPMMVFLPPHRQRRFSTVGNAEVVSDEDDSTSPAVEHPPGIKFKRLDKTAKHIMNILNKEAVDKQAPENKRHESTLKGIVIARHNAGINTTFRLRRLVAGVGVKSVFPLYFQTSKKSRSWTGRKSGGLSCITFGQDECT